MKIFKALVSVFDKENIVEFAKSLSDLGIEITSSGGTAQELKKSGIRVKEVSSVTGFPELMGGRVKTLHPKIHGGILADRSNKKHLEEAKKNEIELIDLVVVNLYPFEKIIQKPHKLEEAIENIDIGGSTLIRSAAKNFKNVTIVTSPSQYPAIIAELRANSNSISEKTNLEFALKAFEYVSHYDVVIEKYLRSTLNKNDYPNYLNLTFEKLQDLRYGENPHQTASFYKSARTDPSISTAKQLQGKQLSYNNILDSNSAFELVKEFDEPTAVVVKHNNPCGVASSKDIVEAYKTAKSVDPEAAFGSIVAVNTPVDEKLAKEIVSTYVEVTIAPSYSKQALEVFKQKKNIRVLEIPDVEVKRKPYREYRSVVGGLLVQDANVKLFDGELKFVTKRKPTEEELHSLKYAWIIAKYVKSNAIVYARGSRAVGIGAGQMKRIDATKLGAMIATSFGEDLKGTVMASDAFFPFRDGIDAAAKLGVCAIIQPGGSIKDDEVIKAADEHGVAMVFTGVRHFRH